MKGFWKIWVASCSCALLRGKMEHGKRALCGPVKNAPFGKPSFKIELLKRVLLAFKSPVCSCSVFVAVMHMAMVRVSSGYPFGISAQGLAALIIGKASMPCSFVGFAS